MCVRCACHTSVSVPIIFFVLIFIFWTVLHNCSFAALKCILISFYSLHINRFVVHRYICNHYRTSAHTTNWRKKLHKKYLFTSDCPTFALEHIMRCERTHSTHTHTTETRQRKICRPYALTALCISWDRIYSKHVFHGRFLPLCAYPLPHHTLWCSKNSKKIKHTLFGHRCWHCCTTAIHVPHRHTTNSNCMHTHRECVVSCACNVWNENYVSCVPSETREKSIDCIWPPFVSLCVCECAKVCVWFLRKIFICILLHFRF